MKITDYFSAYEDYQFISTLIIDKLPKLENLVISQLNVVLDSGVYDNEDDNAPPINKLRKFELNSECDDNDSVKLLKALTKSQMPVITCSNLLPTECSPNPKINDYLENY